MKATVYLRIAKRPRPRYGAADFLFDATTTQPKEPLKDSQSRVLRTAVVKLNLDLPSSLFGPAAEVDVCVDPTEVSPIISTAT